MRRGLGGVEYRSHMTRIATRSIAIDTYRVLFFHLGPFCRLAGGWMACLLGCILVRMVPWPESIALVLLLITLACLAVFSAAFSVNWYRALLDEEPAPDLVPLTLGGRELRFLAYQSAIALVPGIPLLMLVMLLHADAWWAAALTIVHGGSLSLMPTLRLIAGFAFSIPATSAATVKTATTIEAFDIPGRRVKVAGEWSTWDIIVSTLSPEDLFQSSFGSLRWMGRDFFKIVLPVREALPEHIFFLYYANEEPFTRLVEYKKFYEWDRDSPTTMIGIEIPSFRNKLYPFPMAADQALAQKYLEL